VTVFDLGRMRHLDLLAMWHYRNPDSHLYDALRVARLPSQDGRLIATLAASTP